MTVPRLHVLVVSQFEPLSEGHGGNHRTYQLIHDLRSLVGADQVSVLALDKWRQTHPRPPVRKPGQGVIRNLLTERLPYLKAAHPVDLMLGRWGQFKRYSTPDFTDGARETIGRLPRPLVCIIENTAFGRAVLPLCKAACIPVVACPQNIESWDRALPFTRDDHRLKGLAALAFADEWQVLDNCHSVLTISRIEQGLLRGLGLKADYCSYRPVGAVADYFHDIRRKRASPGPAQGLLVILGSCAHLSTRLSTERLLGILSRINIRPDFRIVLAGSRSESLVIPPSLVRRVECRGRISNEEMGELLAQATAMLVSQDIGFGALTRISEFACAGIPVVASDFVHRTMETPPGVLFAGESTGSWALAIETVLSHPCGASEQAYREWAGRTAESSLSPLNAMLQSLATGAAIPPH